MSSANFKCIPLLNLLRFQGGELEERVFDAKFQDFMAAAKSDLEKAQTQKADQKPTENIFTHFTPICFTKIFLPS